MAEVVVPFRKEIRDSLTRQGRIYFRFLKNEHYFSREHTNSLDSEKGQKGYKRKAFCQEAS